MNDDIIEGGFIARIVGYYWLWLALIIAGTLVILMFYPTFLGLERKAYTQSHQYVESYKERVLEYVQEYDELETEISKYADQPGNEEIVRNLRMQQRSLKKKIQNCLSKIPEASWPQESLRFK